METINYKEIVITAFSERKSQKTPYYSFFLREAKRNKDNYIEYVDFFWGCKHAVNTFKKQIEKQYSEQLAELKLCLKQFVEAFEAGAEITPTGHPITERINSLKAEIAEIEQEGINENYWVDIDEKVKEGDTYFLYKHRLKINDIQELNEDLKRAEKELEKKELTNENRNIIPFSKLLKSNNNDAIIEKIKQLDRKTPKDIYIILKALFDNGILLMNNNETVFRAFFHEFGYHKSYDTLKRGLNTYDFRKQDKKNQQSISNMLDYLTS